MHRTSAALTRVEALAIVFAAFLALLFVLGSLLPHPPAREESRIAVCKENLSQIGKAINAYSLNYGEYYPFSWMPANARSPREKDAMTSIARLYPEYLGTAEIFRCPSAVKAPSIIFSARESFVGISGFSSDTDASASSSGGAALQDGNFTLTGSSYGYDCRLSPRIDSRHAIAADMDGSHGGDGDTATVNHPSGQNVLYVDGRVTWVFNSFCSNDPSDNIYSEDPWHADTDSFISNNTPPGWDSTPGAFNDLSVSYDGYPDLHPPSSTE